MSWQQRTLATTWPGENLKQQVSQLLQQQQQSWQLLRENEAALDHLQLKELHWRGAHVVAQCNPQRVTSSSAKVDSQSIAQRPCFLCEENLPPQERCIAFGSDFAIAPNPYPIVRRHLSIPSLQHTPQQIVGRAYCILELARALGPDMLVLYNGPRCGASAPDHFHFQAGSASTLPIAQDLQRQKNSSPVVAFNSFGRNVLVLQGTDNVPVVALVERALTSLNAVLGGSDEPMFNLIATHQGGVDRVFFFARQKHRPQCFYAQGSDHIMLSPGALDMAGIVVAARPQDFEKLNAAVIHQVFSEVSIDDDLFDQFVEGMA